MTDGSTTTRPQSSLFYGEGLPAASLPRSKSRCQCHRTSRTIGPSTPHDCVDGEGLRCCAAQLIHSLAPSSHHDFAPDESSWDTVIDWLREGIKPSQRKDYSNPAIAVDLFGDFQLCPTEPFRKGSVQHAK